MPVWPRFLFMATGLEAVVAGSGAGCTAAALVRVFGPRLRRHRVAWSGAAGAMASLGICAAFAVGSVPAIRTLGNGATVIDHVADLDARLARSVRDAGGAGRGSLRSSRDAAVDADGAGVGSRRRADLRAEDSQDRPFRFEAPPPIIKAQVASATPTPSTSNAEMPTPATLKCTQQLLGCR